MAKHRSHIVRPILEETERPGSKHDFVFSDDLNDWMFGYSTAGRKRRRESKLILATKK
jgi:hypothetical protein